MDRVTLLGIPLDPLTQRQAVDRLLDLLSRDGRHHVMTPNSEMLVAASRDAAFADVLRSSTVNLPDGAGLLWMARWTGQRLPERVTGVDTVQQLCGSLSPEHGVFFLGGQPGVAEKASLILKMRNPRLKIAGTYSGSPRDEDARDIIDRINASGARLLLVAYGAPAQDLWIAAHLSKLTTVRVAMGIGGTFDFLAGVQRRAPVFLQRLSLEWAWRLVREPRRIGRIFNAVVVFPLMVIWSRKKMPQSSI